MGANDPRNARPSVTEHRLLGVRASAMTIDDWLAEVAYAIAHRSRCLMVGQNLHSVYLAHHHDGLRALQERADHVRLDGLPLVWIGRTLGLPFRPEHRSGFMDLLGPLFARARSGGWRVFFLGGSREVCGRALEILQQRYPGLPLEGADGFFDLAPGSAGSEARLEAIRAFAPDLLIVGMGMPRQETWMLQHAEQLEVPAIVACGACMDYVADAVPAAPRALSRLGLEWAFRLALEPRRLWRRYLVEPWFVVGLWWRAWWARSRTRIER